MLALIENRRCSLLSRLGGFAAIVALLWETDEFEDAGRQESKYMYENFVHQLRPEKNMLNLTQSDPKWKPNGPLN